jgi:hypothetical protein
VTPNRIVAVYSALLAAPAAGFTCAWTAAHVPGVNIPAGWVGAAFVVGALFAFAACVQWIHGWQQYEARMQDADMYAARVASLETGAAAVSVTPIPAPVAEVDDSDAFDDLLDDDLLDDDLLEDDLLEERLVTDAPTGATGANPSADVAGRTDV